MKIKGGERSLAQPKLSWQKGGDTYEVGASPDKLEDLALGLPNGSSVLSKAEQT